MSPEEGKAALEEVDLNLLYKKNQRVVVVVINLRTVHISTPYHPQENNVKIIDLSMRPSLLNPIPGVPNDRQCLQVNGIVQGEVTQKEDYGYAINLGFAELSGFFKCDTATTDRTSPRSLPHSSPRQRPSLLRRLLDRVVQLQPPAGQRAVECGRFLPLSSRLRKRRFGGGATGLFGEDGGDECNSRGSYGKCAGMERQTSYSTT